MINLPTRMLSDRDAVRLRAKIFFFTRKQKADAEGWIHDLAKLVKEEFGLSAFQSTYHLSVLVKEDRLLRKARGSSLYRVANGKAKQGKPQQKAVGFKESKPPTSRKVKSTGKMSAVVNQPSFQQWVKSEIARIVAYLDDLKALQQ